MITVGLTLWLAAASASERRFAVVIGSNRGDATDAPLRFAEADTRRVASVLTELGGVAPEDLTRLDGVSADDARGVLRRLAQRATTDPADRKLLFVYYSGHADATSLHLAGTRLPLSELESLLTAIPVDARVLVLDACRTGELTRARGAAPAQAFHIDARDELAASGLAIMTSAAAGEDAVESDRLEGGVFTHHFVAGLLGAADASGDGRVTLTEAYDYSYDRTLLATSAGQTLQHPSFSFRLTGRDDLVLTWLDASPDFGTLSLSYEGEYLIFEPNGRDVVSEVVVGAGAQLTVPAGAYLVRWRTPSEVWEADVTVPAGETVEVGAASLRLMPLGQATRRGGEGWRRSALSFQAGGGVSGPIGRGGSPIPTATLGARVDTSFLTFQLRARYGHTESANELVTTHEDLVGGELHLIRMWDAGPVSIGPGVLGGVDGVFQRFDTAGVAPARRAVTGRLGPLLRAEVAVHPRVSIGLQGGVDAMWSPGADGTVASSVVPNASLDLSVWAL